MRSRVSENRGQATAEFAIVVPILLLILLAIFQFGLAFNDYLSLTDAVREGARKAAVSRHLVDPDEYVKEEVVKSGTDLGPDFGVEDVTVSSTWGPGEDVTVSATFPYSINLLGFVVREGDLTSTTTERVE